MKKPLGLAITALIFVACGHRYDIPAFEKIASLFKDTGLQAVGIEGDDSLLIDQVKMVPIDSAKDGLLALVALMRESNLKQISSQSGCLQMAQKVGYEYSEGLLYTGSNPVRIRHYDLLEKVGNEGWFHYVKTYTRYRY